MIGHLAGYLKREELLGVAQLIELARLLADRVHEGFGPTMTAA
jgi:hypothetical protein|nr:hypothetical protein [Pseudomonas reactans]